jgi:hypothetical protein
MATCKYTLKWIKFTLPASSRYAPTPGSSDMGTVIDIPRLIFLGSLSALKASVMPKRRNKHEIRKPSVGYAYRELHREGLPFSDNHLEV